MAADSSLTKDQQAAGAPGHIAGCECGICQRWREPPSSKTKEERLTLDTERQVFFYEQDHYYLSNFSAFCVHWRGQPFFTSEHAYHWARFDLPEGRGVLLQDCVQRAGSAHQAFKFAQENKSKQREDWDSIKVATMREILVTKVNQHDYVRRKLLETGDRELVENSWRDDFWGWGPQRDGRNMLGKLWMEVRAELRYPCGHVKGSGEFCAECY